MPKRLTTRGLPCTSRDLGRCCNRYLVRCRMPRHKLRRRREVVNNDCAQMGLVDAVFLLDNTQLPVFQCVMDTKVPDYEYIQNQLLTIKRESLYKNGILVSDNDALINYVFSTDINFTTTSGGDISDSIILDPVLKIDPDWTVAWSKVGNIYVITVNRNSKEVLDVESDNEDEDEESESEEESNALIDAGKTVKNENRSQYTSLSNDESEEESQVQEQEGKSKSNASEISEIISEKNRQITNHTNALQYLQFHQILIDAIKMMLQTKNITAHKIQLNSHRIVMLLGELVDASIPFITDLNQLRESLSNDSIIDKLVSTTKQIHHSAASSLSNIKKGESINVPKIPKFSSNYHFIHEKSGNATPWRRVQVDNVQNEVFVDITESIEMIVSPTSKLSKISRNTFSNYNESSYHADNSSFMKASIHGHISLTTSLDGAPLLELLLHIPSEIHLPDCYPSLHRGINRKIWENSDGKSIQLIPADEKSHLLSYNIDLKELEEDSKQPVTISRFTGAINAELYSGIGIGRNEFEIVLNTGYGLNSGYGNTETNIKEVENLAIEICTPNIKQESVHDIEDHTSVSGELQLKVLRSSTGTITRLASGNYEWNLGNDIPVGGKFTFRGSFRADENEDRTAPGIVPSFLKVKYKHHGVVPSGIKISAIKIISDNASAKPFKGVKYTAISNNYIVT